MMNGSNGQQPGAASSSGIMIGITCSPCRFV
jgi:hypothetical protein